MLKTTERIITAAELQHNPDQVLQNAQYAPVVVTSEGKPAVYLIGVEAFDMLVEQLIELERNELARNIQQGEQDFIEGNFAVLEEVIARARAKWQDHTEASR